MLLVSTCLVITLFAWFPGKEHEDKGVGCLQPQETCTSDDHGGPRDVHLPWLGGSLVSSVPTAGTTSPLAPPNSSVTTEEVLGDVRHEGNKGKRQSTPYF